MSTQSGPTTRDFHAGTRLSDDPSTVGQYLQPEGFQPMDPANRPTPFKRYPAAPRVELPRDVGESKAPGADVLSGNSSADAPATFDAALLGRFLFYSAGVTRVRTGEGGMGYFRAAPAAGNLHPVEVYVVCGALDGVPAGIHHFAPGDFALETVREGDRRGQLAEAVVEEATLAAPASLILTGVPWRTGWKYTARGLRHVYWDAGSLLAQTLAVAEAAGIPARVHLGFVDAAIAQELGLDGVSEFPVAVVTLGDGAAAPANAGSGDFVAGEPEQISPGPVEFPVVTKTQHASDLEDASTVEQWRKSASSLGRPERDVLPGGPGVGPPGHGDERLREEPASIEQVIRRRGSTRIFRRESISASVARWCLGVASRPVPSDFCTPGGGLLSHHVSVHQVEGVPSGRHQWTGSDFELGTSVDGASARAEAQRLCLGQPLGGDSAFSVFYGADLDVIFDTLGDRGYRAAQLEAGLAAGRLQLAAFAAGLGGTGLTFFDDAVPAAFGTKSSCMLVAAVGPADYRNKPGGLPGRPVELAGFEPLMKRFQESFQQDRSSS